jgi:cilia- and flagella-associated protein 298
MVVIQIKNGDADGFLYETTCSTLNDDLVRDLVRVWNLRIRLAQLCSGLEELAEYGPMKHPSKAGLDEMQEKYNDEKIEKNEHYKPDPTGIRTGNGVEPQLKETFQRVISDVHAVLDKNNVLRKIPINLAILQEKLDLLRGAVIMGKSLCFSHSFYWSDDFLYSLSFILLYIGFPLYI